MTHELKPVSNMESTELNIVFEDDWLLVVDKPAGLLMHPSWLDKHETDTLASRVKSYFKVQGIDSKAHTVHRLDRPTSGLVVIAKDDVVAIELASQFREKKVIKKYWAICRGFTELEFTVDYSLTEELDKIADKNVSKIREPQEAITHFKRLGICEKDTPVSRYDKSRFSLLECSPVTGRKHQIRRHLKHIRHPILSDTKYGCRHHNKLAWSVLDVESLALRSVQISFQHPVTLDSLRVEAPLNEPWSKWLKRFSWS